MAMFDYGRTKQQMKAGCRRQLFEHIGFKIPAICLRMAEQGVQIAQANFRLL
jgi:type III secretory pathway component EscV